MIFNISAIFNGNYSKTKHICSFKEPTKSMLLPNLHKVNRSSHKLITTFQNLLTVDFRVMTETTLCLNQCNKHFIP